MNFTRSATAPDTIVAVEMANCAHQQDMTLSTRRSEQYRGCCAQFFEHSRLCDVASHAAGGLDQQRQARNAPGGLYSIACQHAPRALCMPHAETWGDANSSPYHVLEVEGRI